MLNLGENLKRLRKERNLSQEQLAEMLNVSRQAISKWESNKTYPDIENLILLRNLFNVTLDDLIVNENKTEVEYTIVPSKLPTDNITDYDKNEEENDPSDNLIIGGFIIGISIGFITDNFMWGVVGSFIGMGISYILEYIKKEIE
ncbi:MULTISPECIES: helix-turn-helix domain-containing protein [unclassified Clostridioides]|uniref:helix-turn-helix domain-containing protein n=1 Tax=unclassified Clostridioides TaxID=2635829 RepID=UPI001D1306C2|nr:helix-turn-helix transcriptional regulator [Clostridioides sp. ZZV14-6150]MCC0661936.1 helix-turn-helix transcriptional regulator [Clostridioides sp. ZZV14-6154]MCC0719202.1 helix-turn-helix transcriptional regulator [Clostridioides sp. ZZV14-6105]MCC0724035.1 helix-turn-helix transcriptional regulator [Clostridioides sp. ZZV14-6104]MCC0739743.1 helix-turn-helix transcriptional regulator [Clostridioides sp. ZZV14-5902]MCC0743627.1 helix-turn-helix transcriptional regulator [Clostridioides s